MEKHKATIMEFTDILARLGGGLSEMEAYLNGGADTSVQQAIMKVTEARLWLVNALGIIQNQEGKS